MSTEISVSVALEGLRRLSQGQINANRQAKLLEDQRKAAALKAVAAQQRGTGLDASATGRDAKGRFLYGAKLRPGAKPEEIAAYRQDQGPSWLLAPSDAGFSAIVRNLPPFAFASHPSAYFSMVFGAGEGPLGTNSMYPEAGAVTELKPFRSSWITAESGITSEPISKAFTYEALIKVAPASTDINGPFSNARAGGGNGPSISLGQAWNNFGSPSGYSNIVYLNILCGSLSFGAYDRYNPNDPTAAVIPSLATTGFWKHVAIVQTPGAAPDTRNFAFYLDGSRCFYQADVTSDSLPTWTTGGSDFEANVRCTYGNVNGSPAITNSPTLIHGVRFTPRALYTGTSFTPPTTITSLA